MTFPFSPGPSPDDEHYSRSPRPLSGWLVEPAMILDEASPGFLRQTCRSKPIWRQCFAAILAAGLLSHPALFLRRLHGVPVEAERSWSDLLQEVAEVLPVLQPREMIMAGMESCVDGYLGALAKCGPKLLSRDAYVRLFDLCTGADPMTRRRRRVLEQLASLDEGQFEALTRLDPILVVPVVVNRIHSREQADSLNDMLAVIRACCTTATDDSIRQSLSSFVAGGARRWARNWVERMDIGVSSLIIDDPEFEVVTPGTAARVAERFRNCLKSMRPRMLTGTWAAAVYEPASLILTFVKLADNRWLLTGSHAVANGVVSPVLHQEVRKRVLSLGDRFIVPAETPPELQIAAEMADPFMFGNDLDELA